MQRTVGRGGALLLCKISDASVELGQALLRIFPEGRLDFRERFSFGHQANCGLVHHYVRDFLWGYSKLQAFYTGTGNDLGCFVESGIVRRIHGVLAFLDVLLPGAAQIVEGDDALGSAYIRQPAAGFQARQRAPIDCFCVSAFVSSVSAWVFVISARSSSSSKRAFSSSICFSSRSRLAYIIRRNAPCRWCDACFSFSSRLHRFILLSVISGALSRSSVMISHARISEQQLYLYAQAGVTVFDDILETVFGQSLSEHLPERVLPISSSPPTDFQALVHAEFEDIRKLVEPGKRRHSEALLRLRSLAIVEGCIWGHTLQPAESDLRKLIKRIRKGTPWQDIFPGVASIKLDTEGTGLNVTVRISKHEGEPVRLVKSEDAPDAPIIAVKRVDELGFYSLSFTQLRQKLELSQPKMSAVIWCLGVEGNVEYFKKFNIGKSVFKRYSQKALGHLRKELPALDLDEVWDAYKDR